MEPGRSCSSRSCHRRGLPFSRRGLTRRSLLLPREDVAQVRGGEVLQLVLVAPTDVARRHRLALPAADLHDHLQRYAPFLQALRGVPARAVLDEIAHAGLLEPASQDLVAAVPGELGEAPAVAVEEERLFAGEVQWPFAGPRRTLEAEITTERGFGLVVKWDDAVGAGFRLRAADPDVPAPLALARLVVAEAQAPDFVGPHRRRHLEGEDRPLAHRVCGDLGDRPEDCFDFPVAEGLAPELGDRREPQVAEDRQALVAPRLEVQVPLGEPFRERFERDELVALGV